VKRRPFLLVTSHRTLRFKAVRSFPSRAKATCLLRPTTPIEKVKIMAAILNVLKYMTVVIPLVELIVKGGVRIYRTVKNANIARNKRKKTKLREKLDKVGGGPGLPPGAAMACIAFMLMIGCASPIFDAVRAQLPQSASDIHVDIQSFLKADVRYFTPASDVEQHLSLMCELEAIDITQEALLSYRCPILGNQFGLEVAYLELDGTGKVMNVKGFDNLLYTVQIEK